MPKKGQKIIKTHSKTKSQSKETKPVKTNYANQIRELQDLLNSRTMQLLNDYSHDGCQLKEKTFSP